MNELGNLISGSGGGQSFFATASGKNLDGLKNVIKESYKHEVFVLGIQKNSKVVNASNYKVFKEDIGDIPFKYNPIFWKKFNSPPTTSFYKKSVKELESIFGASLEAQFNALNR